MGLTYDPERAVVALRRRDKQLAKLIRRVGTFALETRSELTPFQTLLRSIVYQQLSGKAAGSIYARVLDLCPNDRKPTPQAMLKLGVEDLRRAGLSRSKVLAVKDLADKTMTRVVPSRRKLETMDDEEIISRLVTVRGVGPWTVEMLLIFHLGRPDVLPVCDLGVRRGFMLAYDRPELPTAPELQQRGECWRPYRSVASWYLWRANELEY